MDTPTDRKINDLEIKIAEHEQTIHELSDMVSAQWHKIDQLSRKLERTNDRLVQLEDEAPSGEIEKPPHY